MQLCCIHKLLNNDSELVTVLVRTRNKIWKRCTAFTLFMFLSIGFYLCYSRISRQNIVVIYPAGRRGEAWVLISRVACVAAGSHSFEWDENGHFSPRFFKTSLELSGVKLQSYTNIQSFSLFLNVVVCANCAWSKNWFQSNSLTFGYLQKVNSKSTSRDPKKKTGRTFVRTNSKLLIKAIWRFSTTYI